MTEHVVQNTPSLNPLLSLHRSSAVAEAFSQHADTIYRFIYSRVGNREDAEDLTSEVFLKATHYLDEQRSGVSVLSWLFTVAGTVLADHWRRYYRVGSVLPIDEAHYVEETDDPNPEEAMVRSTSLVSEILGTLPPRYRQVLELRFLLGYSLNEVAVELGITVGNVKTLQHRALAMAGRHGEGFSTQGKEA